MLVCLNIGALVLTLLARRSPFSGRLPSIGHKGRRAEGRYGQRAGDSSLCWCASTLVLGVDSVCAAILFLVALNLYGVILGVRNFCMRDACVYIGKAKGTRCEVVGFFCCVAVVALWRLLCLRGNDVATPW